MQNMIRYFVYVITTAFVGAGVACMDPSPHAEENKRAKERLFTPEKKETPQRYLENIALPDVLDSKAIQRLTSMTAEEAAFRLKGFQTEFEVKTHMKRGEIENKATEKTRVSVAGDGRAYIQTGDGDVIARAMIFDGQHLFFKNKNGVWRKTRDPNASRAALLNDAYMPLRVIHELANGQLKYVRGGPETYRLELLSQPVTALDSGARATTLPEPSIQPKEEGETQAAPGTGQPGYHEQDSELEKKLVGSLDEGIAWKTATGSFSVSQGVVVDYDIQLSGEIRDGSPAALIDIHVKGALKKGFQDEDFKAPERAIEEVVRKKWPVGLQEQLKKLGLPITDRKVEFKAE